MNRTNLRAAAGPVSLLLIAFVCWFAAGLAADRMVQQELNAAVRTQRQMSASVVDNLAQVIASDLAMFRAVPATMAELDTIQHALAQSQDYAANGAGTEPPQRDALLRQPALAAISGFLSNAQGYSGLDNIWLVNANGLCVASSNATAQRSLVGIDMHSRAWLTNVLLGAFEEIYGVTARHREPGIFIAVPVYDDGALVGAVVARVGIARLRHWVAHPGTFVTDGNGVIIMAHDNTLENHALPGSHATQMSAAERSEVYRRDNFADLSIRPVSQLHDDAPWVPDALAGQFFQTHVHQSPALYEVRDGLNSKLASHIVDPVAAWPELVYTHRRDRVLVFITLAGGAGLLCVLTLSYLRERRHHGATRHLAEQLQAANTLLSAEARHDALTGALSRRYFLDLLRHEIERAQRAGEPLCMAIADLDHFKQINDRFGHAAGDRALEHFVDTCRIELRDGDAIGRLGGEEFGILLPATALTAGFETVERLRTRLKSVPSTTLPAPVKLSVSIGITELGPDDAAERLMSRADHALYAAKSGGRDRSEAVRAGDAAPPARTAAITW
ncbi:diguanylate cyclase [Paraburkholderia acidicola]|uniref:diguanylate cyclase n=1 Tax=Paraburkholderia acidicola TaxID=1912599 RepID=A0ABV1LQK0_9BURK